MNRLIGLIAVVLICAGCTVTVATGNDHWKNDVTWYSPTPSDWLGTQLSFSDIDAGEFEKSVCKNVGKGASRYIISFSGANPGLSLPAATPPATVVPVSECALTVMTAAVDLCVHRTISKNVLDKLENYGADQVVALAGTAAAIATLSHASGKATTLATAGAAGAVALLNGMQKAVPSTTSAPLSSVVSAGLQYLVLTEGAELTDPQKGLLFDAAFSACPVSS